jgi:hypothetical protein
VDVVRAEIAECDRKLARYKAALEAGADLVVVAGWIREAQRQRGAAEGRLTDANTRKERRSVSVTEIKSWADSIGGLLKVLNAADPAEKAAVDRQLGTTLTFDHEKRVVLAESQPRPPVGVVVGSEGDSSTCSRHPRS